MKFVIALVICATFICIASVESQESTGKLDNVDVDAVLKNDRILTNYIKCLLEKGPCTQEGRELKKTMPDAIRTDCKKCTPQQKANTKKIINHIKTKKPNEWKQLTNKYDPTGEYGARGFY